MRGRITALSAVMLVLVAIGLFDFLRQGGYQSLLIPLVIVAIVFVLYKFPPNTWRKSAYRPPAGRPPSKPGPRAIRANSKTDKKRTFPFTVIEGNKNKDDEPPRYH